MSDRFYLTTAIFYPSERPALHSMFEAIGADAIARYQRLLGRETRFLTGLDEHSANVERDARERGVDAHDLIDPWAATWKATFERFGISFDRFIRTTDPDHAAASVEMVRRAQAAGDVYEGVYSGWYCTGCNEFKTDQQLVERSLPRPSDPRAAMAGGEQLLLPALRLPGAARAAVRREPVVLRAGALPQRGARLAARGAP